MGAIFVNDSFAKRKEAEQTVFEVDHLSSAVEALVSESAATKEADRTVLAGSEYVASSYFRWVDKLRADVLARGLPGLPLSDNPLQIKVNLERGGLVTRKTATRRNYGLTWGQVFSCLRSYGNCMVMNTSAVIGLVPFKTISPNCHGFRIISGI